MSPSSVESQRPTICFVTLMIIPVYVVLLLFLAVSGPYTHCGMRYRTNKPLMVNATLIHTLKLYTQ